MLKADSIVSFTTCLDGKKAVMNKEIYAFVTEHRGAEFMCNDVAVSGVIVSHAYNDVEYLFFGNPESGELIKLISKVVNKEQAEKLCLALEKKLGKKISPVFQTDPTLLGGIRVEGEGILFDGSVRKKLREIKDVMIG